MGVAMAAATVGAAAVGAVEGQVGRLLVAGGERGYVAMGAIPTRFTTEILSMGASLSNRCHHASITNSNP